jgi:hypothetical protein
MLTAVMLPTPAMGKPPGDPNDDRGASGAIVGATLPILPIGYATNWLVRAIIDSPSDTQKHDV